MRPKIPLIPPFPFLMHASGLFRAAAKDCSETAKGLPDILSSFTGF